MFTNNRIEKQDSWLSSHVIAAALLVLLVAGCAASGFAQQPQPKAFATLGDGAPGAYAYQKDVGPETKEAPQIQGKQSGKWQRAEASQADQPSKEAWMRSKVTCVMPGSSLPMSGTGFSAALSTFSSATSALVRTGAEV